MKRNQWVGVLVTGLVVVLLFGWLVWPTAWRYEHSDFGSMNVLVRINRFTGNTQMMHPRHGWVDRSGQPPAEPNQFERLDH